MQSQRRGNTALLYMLPFQTIPCDALILRKSPPTIGASPLAQRMKKPPAMQETQKMQICSVGWECSLEKKLVSYSCLQYSCTSIFLPEKSHGQRSLVGYSSKVHKGSGTTEWLSKHAPPTSKTVTEKRPLSSYIESESESEVAQSCPTLCDPVDCSLPGFSVHGIFQARVPEWVAISFSRGSSRPRDRTPDSHILGRSFTLWATREAQVAR